MKVRKVIGVFVAIIGVVTAVSVTDNSACVDLIRGLGISFVAIGILVGGFLRKEVVK